MKRCVLPTVTLGVSPLSAQHHETEMSDAPTEHNLDAVRPIHSVSNHEATAKVTTQYGGMAETSVNALYRFVDVSTVLSE